VPQHLYPHADARLPHVNKQREYQAVTGACLLIGRELFEAVGGFDEGYLNGYEDTDLCLAVRRRGRKVVCCTTAFIYHYGQITEGRTADDDQNAARFAAKWRGQVRVDEADYAEQDQAELRHQALQPPGGRAAADPAGICFVDDLGQGSAFSWIVVELALALRRRGRAVSLRKGPLTDTLDAETRTALQSLMVTRPHPDGVHVKWSHYWPRHLAVDLGGRLNLEFFVINYLFGQPGRQPWDYWLQSLAHDGHHKLPVSGFCASVLRQIGVAAADLDVLPHGYSREIDEVEGAGPREDRFRFLTVTNSHDLERYGTAQLLETYWATFRPADGVVLTVKDYGASSADRTLRDLCRAHRDQAPVEYVDAFLEKRELIRLYRAADAYVSAHRGEGFGMKILDAMACGLPVITPLFGGPTEYCTPENCVPVRFALSPMGECLDRRSLAITNQPLWCEPDWADLGRQLREVVARPDRGRALGERARRDVRERFTWDRVAEQLLTIVDRLEARPRGSRGIAVQVPAETGERSPYWLGCRVSVVIPTYNRKETLLRCLAALARQSILPQEFEVVVVDDGSTDGTEEALSAQAFAFPLRYHRQANQGPGMARNLGMEVAQGEVVLFIGDDIIADERLLEHHLLAHARYPEPGDAVLGHIEWPPWLERTAVMDYVCGEGAQQFGYHYIEKLPALDYGFFYTSNISLKRQFLWEALRAGIRFDPRFRYAAFEDSEFAYRLGPRGLAIHYCKDALVYHDHWMDLPGFARREYHVGQMAVVFARKHPRVDELQQTRWIGDWVDAVERLGARPEAVERLEALDRRTDELIMDLAGRVEAGLADVGRGDARQPPGFDEPSLRAALYSLFGLVFDVARTRGKVHEWFAGTDDPRRVAAAKALLSCVKKLRFLLGKDRGGEELRELRAELGQREATARYFHQVAQHFQQIAEHFQWTTGQLERQKAALETELAAIKASTSWRVVRRLQGLRLRLAPPGSRRERLFHHLRGDE
jgi:GT2 family glycosyltransferase/glycosyltransferase involved in cell wall biosynthesis